MLGKYKKCKNVLVLINSCPTKTRNAIILVLFSKCKKFNNVLVTGTNQMMLSKCKNELNNVLLLNQSRKNHVLHINNTKKTRPVQEGF